MAPDPEAPRPARRARGADLPGGRPVRDHAVDRRVGGEGGGGEAGEAAARDHSDLETRGHTATIAHKEVPMEPTVLWGRFVEEFATQLSNTCSGPAAERLRIAWTSGAARTQFYGGCLLPRVAASLGLKISSEAGKIDWSFSSGHPAKEVVAIESENVGGCIVSEEIPALCRNRA